MLYTDKGTYFNNSAAHIIWNLFNMSLVQSFMTAGRLFSSSFLPANNLLQSRNVVYYTRNKGKRASVGAAAIRFFRLNWGGWIRTRSGRRRHLWRKNWELKWWAKQHVLCSPSQCLMLEKMLTPKWKTPKYFIDDIYEPYHVRNDYVYVPRGKHCVGTSYVDILSKY